MRILGEKVIHEIAFSDPVSGSELSFFYRIPTTDERKTYLASMYKRVGDVLEDHSYDTRVKYAKKILTGIGEDQFGFEVEVKAEVKVEDKEEVLDEVEDEVENEVEDEVEEDGSKVEDEEEAGQPSTKVIQISSDPNNEHYRADWKELIERYLPDMLWFLSHRVFEGAQVTNNKVAEHTFRGDEAYDSKN